MLLLGKTADEAHQGIALNGIEARGYEHQLRVECRDDGAQHQVECEQVLCVAVTALPVTPC